MKATRSTTALLLSVTITVLSGCVGLVSGDLKNVQPVTVSECRRPLPEYRLKVESTARNDYGHNNLSGLISSFTLGLVPTYWLNSAKASTFLYKETNLVSSYQYTAKVHTFYGALWPLVLSAKQENRLGWNEGTGLEVEQGIRQRVVSKALTQYGVDASNACYFLSTNP